MTMDEIKSKFRECLTKRARMDPEFSLVLEDGDFIRITAPEGHENPIGYILNDMVDDALQRMQSYLKPHKAQQALEWIDGGVVKKKYSSQFGNNLRWEIIRRDQTDRSVTLGINIRELGIE